MKKEEFIKSRYISFIKNNGECNHKFCGELLEGCGVYIDCPFRKNIRCIDDNAYEDILNEFITLYGEIALFEELL
jgi:hypothetical protein